MGVVALATHLWGSSSRHLALGTYRGYLNVQFREKRSALLARFASPLRTRLTSKSVPPSAACINGEMFSRLINFFHRDPNESDSELRASLQLASDVKCRPGEVDEAKRTLQGLRRSARAMTGVRRE